MCSRITLLSKSDYMSNCFQVWLYLFLCDTLTSKKVFNLWSFSVVIEHTYSDCYPDSCKIVHILEILVYKRIFRQPRNCFKLTAFKRKGNIMATVFTKFESFLRTMKHTRKICEHLKNLKNNQCWMCNN